MNSTENNNSCAFVAGATGYTGREVVRLLAEKGVDTIAHVRPDSTEIERWRKTFGDYGARIDLTPWQPEAISQALGQYKPDYVFGLLGTIRARMNEAKKQGRDPQAENYQAVDYGLTSMLLGAAQSCASGPKFIYLSAAGVNDKSKSAYYAARAKMEKELTASDLPYAIARPSFITGPDRDDHRTMERASSAIADAGLSLIGFMGGKGLMQRYRSTTNTALAEALVRIALDPEAAGIFESEQLRTPT
jgi:uncharacterized protein YbjT (DUF2867 family)